MQFDAGTLCHGSQAFDPVDLHIRFSVPGNGNLFEEIGSALHRMPLEKPLSANPVRRSDDRARAALEVLHHPCADDLEISRQVELCDGAFALVGPKDLVGPAQGHPHHHAIARFRIASRAAPCRRRCCDVGLVGGGRGLSFDLLGGLILAKSLECQSAFKFGSDSLLMQFGGCLAL
jgi:hypothetical protein